RIIPKNLQTKSELITHFIKNVDWIKLEKSLQLRQCNNNIPLLQELLRNLEVANAKQICNIENEILKLPNSIHPRIWDYGNEAKEIFRSNTENCSKSNSLQFSELCKNFNIFRMDHLGNYAGHKSYYLLGKLAELEQALIQYSTDVLKKNSFELLSVPDILSKEAIEGCGMQTDGDRNQVYKINNGRCLSGTAEIGLASYFSNKVFDEGDLPIKCAAISRCYRAETSGLNEEKGIFRVHQFTKVEMFSVCTQSQSELMLDSFKDVETALFTNLNLSFRLLDMPPIELGDSAYQKYDIEAWMPGRKIWGEISSCSNCTDFQAKRLNIKYIAKNGDLHYAHTVNGTASAIPRLLISLVESNQVDKNTVKLPEVLLKYLRKPTLEKEKKLPDIKDCFSNENLENALKRLSAEGRKKI
ncbi:hypothetical protein DOY81_007005, partial [Sarcophaga bullata]